MKEACELAEIILSCLCCSPKQRPTMSEVVANLEQLELELGLHNQRSYGRNYKFTPCPTADRTKRM